MSAGSGGGARRFVRRVHLWLGLTIGALFALAGLTGAALVFYPEIETATLPALRAVPAGARPPSWQAVVDVLHRAHPDRTGAWRIEVTDGGGAIPVRYYGPVERAGHDFAPLMLWIDPVRMTTIRHDYWGDTLFTWIYDLHYRLLLERPGGTVMGIAGIGMLALLASGLWAWWPRPGGWARSLRFKRGAVPIRRLYDWHKLCGIAGAIVLIVVTGTGVLLDLPDQARPAIAAVSPLAAMPKPVVRAGGAMLPIDRLVAVARVRFKRGAVPIRRLYDWHKLCGIAGAIVLIVVTGTGVLLDLPDQARPAIAAVSPLAAMPKPVVRAGGAMLPIDRLVAVARVRFPDAALAWIETPAGPTRAVRINLARPGEPSRRFPRTNVWIDPYRGQIVAARDAGRRGGGDAVLAWLHPLHGGEAFGLAGRLLVLLSGGAAVALFVTGVLRWRARRRRAGSTEGFAGRAELLRRCGAD